MGNKIIATRSTLEKETFEIKLDFDLLHKNQIMFFNVRTDVIDEDFPFDKQIKKTLLAILKYQTIDVIVIRQNTIVITSLGYQFKDDDISEILNNICLSLNLDKNNTEIMILSSALLVQKDSTTGAVRIFFDCDALLNDE